MSAELDALRAAVAKVKTANALQLRQAAGDALGALLVWCEARERSERDQGGGAMTDGKATNTDRAD